MSEGALPRGCKTHPLFNGKVILCYGQWRISKGANGAAAQRDRFSEIFFVAVKLI